MKREYVDTVRERRQSVGRRLRTAAAFAVAVPAVPLVLVSNAALVTCAATAFAAWQLGVTAGRLYHGSGRR